MNISHLLAELSKRGATVSTKGDNLFVVPSCVLDDDLRAEIRRLKPHLLKWLRISKSVYGPPLSRELTETEQKARDQRIVLAEQIGAILTAFPDGGVKRLNSGDWRMNDGAIYDHENAVLLAARTTGTTGHGKVLEVCASDLFDVSDMDEN